MRSPRLGFSPSRPRIQTLYIQQDTKLPFQQSLKEAYLRDDILFLVPFNKRAKKRKEGSSIASVKLASKLFFNRFELSQRIQSISRIIQAPECKAKIEAARLDVEKARGILENSEQREKRKELFQRAMTHIESVESAFDIALSLLEKSTKQLERVRDEIYVLKNFKDIEKNLLEQIKKLAERDIELISPQEVEEKTGIKEQFTQAILKIFGGSAIQDKVDLLKNIRKFYQANSRNLSLTLSRLEEIQRLVEEESAQITTQIKDRLRLKEAREEISNLKELIPAELKPILDSTVPDVQTENDQAQSRINGLNCFYPEGVEGWLNNLFNL